MRALLVATLLTTTAFGFANAQPAASSSRDSVSEAAASLLGAGRGNEARILLQRSLRSTSTPELRAVYRLHVGDSYLYDGQYAEAKRTYASVLSGDDVKGIDSLTSWAHRGLGMAEAFSGQHTQGAAHLAQAFDGAGARGVTLTDSIEMLVVTGQYDAASKALDRLAASPEGTNQQQYVQAFRALNALYSGHCTAALENLARAPDQNRTVPRAVRGRCAAKRGDRAQALVLRDSVLKETVADPFAWRMLIARDAARKIH